MSHYFDPHAQLSRAYELMENRVYAEAAPLFGQLADWAITESLFERAASFASTASRAYCKCSNLEQGVYRLRQSLHLWEQTGNEWRASQVLLTMTTIWREQQLHTVVNLLEREFAHLFK